MYLLFILRWFHEWRSSLLFFTDGSLKIKNQVQQVYKSQGRNHPTKEEFKLNLGRETNKAVQDAIFPSRRD